MGRKIKTSLPKHFKRDFTVKAAFPKPGETRTTDDLPAGDAFVSGNLTRTITYTGELERRDGRWHLNIQWVDLENEGHRIALVHEPVEEIMVAARQIIGDSRKDRGQNAAQTRRERQEAGVYGGP
tara:strand:- start:258 stop:632 length:375 start_codon:yes stop_codon:yes gene_type:complete